MSNKCCHGVEGRCGWCRMCDAAYGNQPDTRDERIAALEAKCALLAASLKQADGRIAELTAEIERLKAERPFLRSEHREMSPRPVVAAFAMAMEEKLRENDHKGGWDEEAASWLLSRLSVEYRELASAVRDIGVGGETWQHRQHRVLREAADVANFAMMVADACGAIVTPPGGREP